MDANVFIREHIKLIDGILIAPDIPEKKLNNAIKAFQCEDSVKSIIALYDNTLFGSAKDGLIFTGEKMIFKKDDRLVSFYYKQISKVEYFEENILIKENKTKSTKGIKIFIDDEAIEIKDSELPDSLYKLLEFFLDKLLKECNEFKEVDLLKPLEDMPNELKNAYIKILINMAFDNDGKIDEKELAELMFLIGRINIDEEGRFELRNYMAEIQHSIIPVQQLLDIIKNQASIIYETIMISLVKDMFNIHASTTISTTEGNITIESFNFLEQHKSLFGLSADKIEFARKAVENDFKILYENVDDNKIQELLKDLAAKAASIGAPIGAVYFSGSVIGLSAAGMTSGLATLGMGGILGLSSMATGIGVAVLLGVGVYQGVKYLTSNNELSKYKTREFMLHEVIKQTQKSISLMIGDINVIVKKLNDVILHHSEDRDTIEKLSKMLVRAQGAIEQMSKKNDQCNNMKEALQCPIILEISRISELAAEPTKKEIYIFILSCYDEKEVDGKSQFIRKQHIATDRLEKLGDILKGIGYFDTTNVVKGNIKNLADGILDKGKGLFNG